MYRSNNYHGRPGNKAQDSSAREHTAPIRCRREQPWPPCSTANSPVAGRLQPRRGRKKPTPRTRARRLLSDLTRSTCFAIGAAQRPGSGPDRLSSVPWVVVAVHEGPSGTGCNLVASWQHKAVVEPPVGNATEQPPRLGWRNPSLQLEQGWPSLPAPRSPDLHEGANLSLFPAWCVRPRVLRPYTSTRSKQRGGAHSVAATQRDSHWGGGALRRTETYH